MVFRKATAIVAIVGAFTAGTAVAETMSDAEFAAFVQDLSSTAAGPGLGRAAIAGIPSGFLTAPGHLNATLSGSYGPPRGGPGSTRFDASTSLAVGFGDPVNAVGVEVGLVNLSFRRFGHSGYFSVGFHRQFSTGNGGTGSVALTVDQLGAWGDARGNRIGGTLVVSTMSDVPTATGRAPVMVSFGAGTNITRDKTAGVVAGVGTGLSPDWSVSAGIYGDSGLVGATWHPTSYPGFTVGFTARKQESTNAVFGVDVGYAFNIFGG